MNDSIHQLERLRAAYAASGDIAYDWSLADDGMTWLGGRPEAFGLASFDLLPSGEALHQRIHPHDLAGRLEALGRLYRGAGTFECQFRLRGGDGGFRWFHDRGTPVPGAGERPQRLSGIIRAIDGLRLADSPPEQLACHDGLTGHYNRARLREAFDQALYCALRYEVSGAFLVVGIDKINMVNQAFGYEVADSVIVAVGRRLGRCMRASDHIGRLGGDRFGIVLCNCPPGEVSRSVEKILEEVRNTRVETSAGPIHVTCSVGAAVFPGDARNSLDAMTKAEIALQNAKRMGGNSWSVYSYSEEQRLAHRRNMVIAEQVKRALLEDRLSLAFQPIVRAGDYLPEMYECLLRMTQPGGEIVPAGSFMPVVEELGLIRLIDRRVLDLAVAQLAAFPQARLAINVSALTAVDPSWLATTIAALRPRPGIAERLVVEITETAGLNDIDACARFVSTLRDLGCRVALDDFGAGYTSFRHLKLLAVDMVKIDGSFVRDIASNPHNLIFIRTLLGLAGNFGLQTVAECVERMEEAELLRAEGVELLQGWAFGRPEMEAPWAADAAPAPRALQAGIRTG